MKASYTIPGENLGIESVRERYYSGLCRDSHKFRETLDLFQEKKAGIMELVAYFPYLGKGEKAELRS